jgi:hypothetical protein
LAYFVLSSKTDSDREYDEIRLLTKILKSHAPSIVLVFSSHYLQNKAPIRHNLFRRKFIVPCRVLRVKLVEFINHLFVTCDFAYRVWYKVNNWLGWELISPPTLSGLFSIFVDLGVRARIRIYKFNFGLTCYCVVHLKCLKVILFFLTIE